MDLIAKTRIIGFLNLLFIVYSYFFTSVACSQHVTISALPSWVNAQQADLKFQPSEKDISNGYYFLLVDKQGNIALQEHFVHHVVKIINSQGVQNMSDISAEFDPHYQKLTFNQIHLIRNGVSIDKLLTNKIKTVQRETNMERFSYDGRVTAFVNLTDVREGDIIDYSYTTTGQNPRYNGHYFSEIYFETNVAVHHLYMRLIAPNTKVLHFKYMGAKLEPSVAHSANSTEYIWQSDNVRQLKFDENTPNWFDPYRRVCITDFTSWHDLTQWIIKDYSVSDQEKNKIKEALPGIIKSSNPDQRVVEAIHFVQDKVRYLAFESGLSAYVPNAPSLVLQRRYGDCKDKSLLLCAILQAMDVKALPVLVNSEGLMDEAQIQPSPTMFNHCIVQVYYKGSYWYVDPTITNQGGSIATFYVPDYGESLVLRNETEGTSRIHEFDAWRSSIVTIFDLDSMVGNAKMTVRSRFEKGQADYNRVYFATTSTDEISEDYLSFYRRVYPDIKSTEKITYTDDRDANIFTVEENYFIEHFWEKDKDNDQKNKCCFFPLTIRSHLKAPSSAKRTMPFAFHFPAQIEEDIEINVPTTFKIDPKNINIDNEIFYYDYSSVNLSDNRIKLTYQFRSKANQVDVAQMPVFIHNVNKFFDEAAGYSLIYNPSLAKPSRFSWMMALIALLVFMLAIYLARKLYFNYDVPSQMNTFMSHKRIEGWLVLVAIGLIFSLVSYIYSLFFQSDYFDAKIIQAIFVQKEVNSEIWSLLVIVEMIIHVLFIVYVGLLIVLFFKRRTVLPGLMIILYISIFVYNLGDHIIAAKVLNQTHVDPKTIFLIAGNFIGAVIWIPYFLYSNRVKNTFVVQIRKASITHTEQSPEADESIGHELISDSNSSAKPLETPVTDENTPVEDSAYDEEVY